MDETFSDRDDGRTNDRVTVPIRIRFWGEKPARPESKIEPAAGVAESAPARGSDRRAAVRVPRAVDIQFWIDGTEQRGRIEDLSETGLFVSTTHYYERDCAVRFRFRLPDRPDSEPIEGRGKVVWTEQIGFAIEFDELERDAGERLRSFIEDEVAASLALESAAL